MNTPHRHHYVAQLALRRFANHAGYLWVHDSVKKKRWSCKPASAGFENNFYALNLDGENPDHSLIEKALAEHFDGPGDDAISGLLNRQTLDKSRWIAFINYVAAQMQRTPAALDRLKALHQPVFQEMCERMAKYDAEFRENLTTRLLKDGDSPEDIDRLFDIIRNGGMTVTPARDFILLESLKMIERVVAELLKMKWTFMDIACEDPDLIIGDHPVLLAAPGSSASLGIRNPATEILLPLSPRMVAVAKWNGPYSYGVLEYGMAEMINERTLRHAHRFAFASIDSEALLEQAIKLRSTGPKLRSRRVRVGQGLMIVNEFS